MKILEVSRYKDNFSDHQLPFVTEQGQSLQAAGCEVDYFLVKGNYLTAISNLKSQISKFHPDIVHAHFGLSAITAELQSQVPVVTTFHNGETLNWHVNLLSSLLSLRAKHVIYVAKHVRDLCYFKHPNYTILPCGVPMDQLPLTPYVEARKQLGWSENEKYILFGGAFDNLRKNYPLLRDALALINQSKISNQKSQTKNLKSIINVVEMKGLTRTECALRMCACDLFALPTHSEGSPQALKEAMACNCPIVATDCVDIAYLLGDLEGHYILRNPRKTKERWDADGNSVEELRLMIEEALSLPAGFRTEGRKRIEELGLRTEDVAKKLIEIYTNVLQK